MKDPIERREAIDALWKALYEYEDKTEKQFQESEDLNVGDWIEHRAFVQNMNDIDRQTILNLPSAQPERKKGRWLPDNIPGGGFWVCSCCKFPSEAFAADVLYKFCPNCGADMRKARWNG